VTSGVDVKPHLRRLAREIAAFHATARSNSEITDSGSPASLRARWSANVAELRRRGLHEARADLMWREVTAYIDGRWWPRCGTRPTCFSSTRAMCSWSSSEPRRRGLSRPACRVRGLRTPALGPCPLAVVPRAPRRRATSRATALGNPGFGPPRVAVGASWPTPHAYGRSAASVRGRERSFRASLQSERWVLVGDQQRRVGLARTAPTPSTANTMR
jgi:hypothetical protein